MARPGDDEQEEKPLDPAVEKVRRKLLRFIAINLGLLFLALMAVLAAVVYKTRMPDQVAAPGNEAVPSPAEGGVIAGDILLPTGARLVSQSLSGNRIALHTELAGGGRAIFLYDFAERRIVGRFDLKSE